MPPKSKVDLYAAIRRDSRAGLSNRALQQKYGVGFRTVQKALVSVWPKPRKKPPPRRTRLDPYKGLVDEMLRADLNAPRKQQHTAKWIFDRLLAVRRGPRPPRMRAVHHQLGDNWLNGAATWSGQGAAGVLGQWAERARCSAPAVGAACRGSTGPGVRIRGFGQG
ncbi:hypothetical protein ABZ307_42305 [Streptomyces griseorubiginosus]|uniref:hypothetical protein n=1 Tax=Streptomyces griseorubiginosus TaxID=67304 RepID=UPI0033A0C9EF